jgi:predicted phage terminase large subunit-like protein
MYPDYLDAPHLAKVFELFERAKRGERVYACISMPPRGSKTETLIAGICDRLRHSPGTRVGYGSYSARFARKKSARARSFYASSGNPIDQTSRSKDDWRTGIGEGGLWATSSGGSITGEGFELLLLDDLLKGREDAESVVIRDTVYDWIKSDCLTRMEPNGSVIVCGTRWHEDDHIGRLLATGEFEEIVIPALTDDGESYWPERWPTERLYEIRTTLGGEDGYDWCALYMANPRAQGERIFHDATTVPEVVGFPRYGIGVDFAYTLGKSSDYSAAVVLAEWQGQYTVVDVLRAKLPEAEFRARVAAMATAWGAQFTTGYIAATEKPNIELMGQVTPTFGQRAVSDKKTRALPTAASWNLGRIKVLADKPWSRDFIREVEQFTGADRHDDQVDALAAVFDAMFVGGPVDWDTIKQLQDAAPVAISWELN